jgi:hypothetical protein
MFTCQPLANTIPTHTTTTTNNNNTAGFPPVEPVKAAAAPTQDETSQKQSAATALGDSMKEVVGSWRTWVLAVTYFFVYLIRQGCTSWLVFYLLEVKGAVDAAAAALTVSGATLCVCVWGGFFLLFTLSLCCGGYRQGCTSWLVIDLLEVKGAVDDAAAAALTVSDG